MYTQSVNKSNFFYFLIKFLPDELPNGLDTEVDDIAAGGNMTPTDRQLISLARSVLKQPR